MDSKAQLALVVVGQGFATYVAYRIGRRVLGERAGRVMLGLAPMLVLAVAWSIFNLWVLNLPMMDRH